jgi:Leucine-rich repeat (LRR) protein
LSGWIPSSLGSLTTNLQYLFVYESFVRFDSFIIGLTNLQDMDLNTNHLSGSIPSLFDGPNEIVLLVLYTNHLSGSIPSSLGSLTNLKDMDLDTNHLSGWIPSLFDGLNEIVLLVLYSSHLSGWILSSLGRGV